jgi:hypothetical protein
MDVLNCINVVPKCEHVLNCMKHNYGIEPSNIIKECFSQDFIDCLTNGKEIKPSQMGALAMAAEFLQVYDSHKEIMQIAAKETAKNALCSMFHMHF